MPNPPAEALAGPPAGAPAGGDPAAAAAWLERNAVDSLPRGGLEAKLKLGRPLRVKLGVDPTAPDLTLGHTVVLQKLREFQDLGHTAVLIIGNGTTLIGDPSGRSSTRPVLTQAEIEANVRTYQEQAFKVLDREPLEVLYNADWLMMGMPELFRLLGSATVAHVIEREDFAKRLAERTPISMLELLYPLLQGYDSVAVRSDVELGGTDQTFNLLMGRDIQRAYGQDSQVILTVPLLVGTDGEKKMSKSVGNYIGVSEPPGEIYGKTLSLPDAALRQWYELLLGSEPPAELGPRDAKRALARALCERFAGEGTGEQAQAEFDRVFVRKDVPEAIPEVEHAAPDSQVHLPALLAAAFGVSTSEARRSLVQGAVKLDGQVLAGGTLEMAADELDGRVLQLGKRRFARVRIRR